MAVANVRMNNSLRVVFDKIKEHPIYALIAAIATPPLALAYGGLLSHWGVEGWLVEFTQSEILRWLLTAFVEYWFVSIIAVAMLGLGMHIGSRDAAKDRIKLADAGGGGSARVGPPEANATLTPSSAMRLGAKPVRPTDLSTMLTDGGNDHPIIPRSFIVRAKKVDDGFDVEAMLYFRNRSMNEVSVEVGETSWSIGAIKSGVVKRSQPKLLLKAEEDRSVRFAPVRVYEPRAYAVTAKFEIFFWAGEENATAMVLEYAFDVSDFPETKSTDRALKVAEPNSVEYRGTVFS